MLDVSAVTARLLTSVLSRALRRRLLALHRDDLVVLRTLLFVVALHDIGKATPAFQAKVGWAHDLLPLRGFDLNADRGARHHGDIGLFLLYAVLQDFGAEPDVALPLARAVTAHHGEFPTDLTGLRTPGRRERGESSRWQTAREGITRDLGAFLGLDALPPVTRIDHAFVALLAGLTSVADWIGSMDTVFRYAPPQVSLGAYWPVALARADTALAAAGMRASREGAARSFKDLFPDYAPRPLHRVADAVATQLKEPALVIAEAPMGEGKTEHALVLAEAAAANVGQTGLFIGLPTQATANQMLGRVEDFLRRTRSEPATLLLTHGEAPLVHRFQRLAGIYDSESDSTDGAVRAEAWFLSKKRALLAEYAVGTIDQALLSVMRVAHAFVRIYGLAGKTVILDEVHAYDTYTGTLLDRLIEWLAAAGTTVVLLSATLPSNRRADFVRAYRRGAGLKDQPTQPVAYPRVTVTSGTTSEEIHFEPRSAPVEVELLCVRKEIDRLADEVVSAAQQGACVGWICNTVGRAQEAARRVGTRAAKKLVIHARLLPDDRSARETLLDRWLGPETPETRIRERPAGCVVIGTQVLEQSLDVDFDLLVTDVAPMDLVLQRAGRLWRHDRTNRSTAYTTPRLIVVCPQGSWSTAKLEDVAKVYEELWLRRTLRALEGRTTLTLPDEIEPLVEAAYARYAPEVEPELERAFIEHEGSRAAYRTVAEQKLLPHPFVADDPFTAFRVFLHDDDDPALHEHLRAVTRLGPPSVELVCVERRGGQLFVGDDMGAASPLDLTQPPERALVSRLVRRSISVSTPGIVHTIEKHPDAAPASWEKVPLLRYRRLVAFEDRQARVGDVGLRLDPELGLCIEVPRRTA
jgi:CRISPR-associated endonuclease/helicase Cas3